MVINVAEVTRPSMHIISTVVYPGILFGGVQQIQMRTEDSENGDLGAVVPSSGVLEAAVIWYKKFHFI
jgi:hypothetical protein